MSATEPTSAPAEADVFGAHAPTGYVGWLISLTRRMPDSWLGRRMAFVLRRAALQGLKEPVDTEVLGARFRLHPFDNVCDKRILFTPQFFDPAEREILARHIGERFVFIDIGANIGAYALFVAGLAGPSGRILAIEPQPGIFERLVRNIRENPGGTIKAIECAVADRDGEVTLFLDRHNRGETGVKFVRPEAHAAGQVSVPARTLHAILRDEGIDHVDAIKLDVEGAEDLILEPFFRTAPESLWPSLLIVEHAADRWQMDLKALLRDCGYRVICRTRLNIVLERKRHP